MAAAAGPNPPTPTLDIQCYEEPSCILSPITPPHHSPECQPPAPKKLKLCTAEALPCNIKDTCESLLFLYDGDISKKETVTSKDDDICDKDDGFAGDVSKCSDVSDFADDSGICTYSSGSEYYLHQYDTEAYTHRIQLEKYFHPKNCLKHQPQVTETMRAMLIEWLAKLQVYFKFNLETLFLACNIMDRFLVTTPVSRDCFQLLGITSFLIAGKQEEVMPPEIRELLRLCGFSYSREQVRHLERLILTRLQFDLLAPTCVFFLDYHVSTLRRSVMEMPHTVSEQFRKLRALGRYLLELSLQDYALCQYKSSLLAASALQVSSEIRNFFPLSSSLQMFTYKPTDYDQCLGDFRMMAQVYMMNPLDMDAIFRKYSDNYEDL